MFPIIQFQANQIDSKKELRFYHFNTIYNTCSGIELPRCYQPFKQVIMNDNPTVLPVISIDKGLKLTIDKPAVAESAIAYYDKIYNFESGEIKKKSSILLLEYKHKYDINTQQEIPYVKKSAELSGIFNNKDEFWFWIKSKVIPFCKEQNIGYADYFKEMAKFYNGLKKESSVLPIISIDNRDYNSAIAYYDTIYNFKEGKTEKKSSILLLEYKYKYDIDTQQEVSYVKKSAELSGIFNNKDEFWFWIKSEVVPFCKEQNIGYADYFKEITKFYNSLEKESSVLPIISIDNGDYNSAIAYYDHINCDSRGERVEFLNYDAIKENLRTTKEIPELTEKSPELTGKSSKFNNKEDFLIWINSEVKPFCYGSQMNYCTYIEKCSYMTKFCDALKKESDVIPSVIALDKNFVNPAIGYYKDGKSIVLISHNTKKEKIEGDLKINLKTTKVDRLHDKFSNESEFWSWINNEVKPSCQRFQINYYAYIKNFSYITKFCDALRKKLIVLPLAIALDKNFVNPAIGYFKYGKSIILISHDTEKEEIGGDLKINLKTTKVDRLHDKFSNESEFWSWINNEVKPSCQRFQINYYAYIENYVKYLIEKQKKLMEQQKNENGKLLTNLNRTQNNEQLNRIAMLENKKDKRKSEVQMNKGLSEIKKEMKKLQGPKNEFYNVK